MISALLVLAIVVWWLKYYEPDGVPLVEVVWEPLAEIATSDDVQPPVVLAPPASPKRKPRRAK